MVKLQEGVEQFEEAGLQVVSVSYDSPEVLKRYAERKGISYPMLSDEGSATIDAYGIRNTESEAGSRYDGIPYPGTFLIATDGTIADKLFLEGYMHRHSNEDLLKMAEKLD